MKQFISYFDILGFKSFIQNNDLEQIRHRLYTILHDTEFAMGQGRKTKTEYGYISDLSQSNLNCLNISDTIIFWTKNDNYENFAEILKVSFDFCNYVSCSLIPLRGALVYDEIDSFVFDSENSKQSTYRINSIYGKGLVKAHLKAENLNLAGCVVDNSVIEKISEYGDYKELLEKYALPWKVLYKNNPTEGDEYMLKYSSGNGMNALAFENRKKQILTAFKRDNKEYTRRAEEIYENTVKFLELHKE